MGWISNDVELHEAVGEANALLQAITDYVGRVPRDDAKLRFPRGYIRTAHRCRQLLRFVRKPVLRTNLGYQLMLADVYHWVLRHTDISGTARDMLVKAVLVHAGGIAEALLIDYYDGVMGKRQRFTARTQRLVDEGIVEAALQAELDWLWDMRCRQHLFELDQTEFYHYEPDHPERAATAVNALMRAIDGRLPRRAV